MCGGRRVLVPSDQKTCLQVQRKASLLLKSSVEAEEQKTHLLLKQMLKQEMCLLIKQKTCHLLKHNARVALT